MSADDRRGRPVGNRTRQRRDLARQTRRSLGLTALALIPGAGLTQTRYRLFGWILLALFVLSIVGLALLVLAKGAQSTILSVAVQPDMLMTLAGISVVVGLVWIFSVILTHRGSEPPAADGVSRLGMRSFTAVVCLLVALPTVQLVRYAAIQRDLVGTVFTGRSSGTGGADGGLAGTAKPNSAAADPWKSVFRVTMLLVGSDAGSDRTGTRTDSMVVASVNPRSGNAVLISIPRNLERVPFPASDPLHKLYPNGFYCPEIGSGHECLLNAVWKAAEDNRSLFKNDANPGLTALRDVLEEITGLRMDYSTVIDLDGFSALVEAMGGVMVDVKERLPIGGEVDSGGRLHGETGWVEKGYQRLDGYHALWYARSRVLSSDYDRMRRQRCLIGAIIDQVNPVMMLNRYPALARVARDNISTDLAPSELPAWVDLVQRIKRGSITSLTFTSDNIAPGRPDFARMRSMVAEAIAAGDPGPTPSSTTTSSTATDPTPRATTPGSTGSGSTRPGPALPPGTATTSTETGPVDLQVAC